MLVWENIGEFSYLDYRTQEIFGGRKIGKFTESWAIHQNFLANIHRYTENVFGICSL